MASKTVLCFALMFVLLLCITISSAGIMDAVGTMAPMPSGMPTVPTNMPTVPTSPNIGTTMPVTIPK